MRDKVFLDTNIVIYSYSEDEVEAVVLELNNNFPIVNFTLQTQLKAIEIKERYQLQFYDSLILATALENGCNIVYSEDMQNGQVIDNQLTIVNPFEV